MLERLQSCTESYVYDIANLTCAFRDFSEAEFQSEISLTILILMYSKYILTTGAATSVSFAGLLPWQPAGQIHCPPEHCPHCPPKQLLHSGLSHLTSRLSTLTFSVVELAMAFLSPMSKVCSNISRIRVLIPVTSIVLEAFTAVCKQKWSKYL